MFMDTAFFLLSSRDFWSDDDDLVSPEDWPAFILAVVATVASDALLKKLIPGMNEKIRRAFSSIPMIIILFVYMFIIKNH